MSFVVFVGDLISQYPAFQFTPLQRYTLFAWWICTFHLECAKPEVVLWFRMAADQALTKINMDQLIRRMWSGDLSQAQGSTSPNSSSDAIQSRQPSASKTGHAVRACTLKSCLPKGIH